MTEKEAIDKLLAALKRCRTYAEYKDCDSIFAIANEAIISIQHHD